MLFAPGLMRSIPAMHRDNQDLLPTLLSIEVACGTADRQEVLPLTVPAGTTLIEAVHQSGILTLFPDLELNDCGVFGESACGVFGEIKDTDYLVREGDRIELYRKLQNDPKEARRKRAGDGKSPT